MTELNKDFLPPKIAYILENYLERLFDTTPPAALLLDLLIKIGQIGVFKRLHVRYHETETIVNIYGLLFLRSGEGKDKPLNEIDKNFMKAYHYEFNKCQAEYIEDKTKKITKEAQDKFLGAKASRENYIEAHKPRMLVKEMSDATLEGFLALREAYSEVNFGGTFIKISEFGDYISSDNNSRREFISIVTETFDTGDNKAKVIKMQKDYKSIEGIPGNVIFHTSLAGLISGKSHYKLLEFLNRGLGRRAFIVCPSPISEIPEKTFEEREEEIKKLRSELSYIQGLFDEFTRKHKFNSLYIFSKKADEKLYEYKKVNMKNAAKINKNKEEAIIAEIKNRHWKVVKLAGLIAAFEHPTEYEVNEEDLGYAIYIADYYGEHFLSFFEKRELEPERKLYEYLKENQGVWLSKSELREQNFVWHNRFKGWLIESLEEIEVIAEDNGYELQLKDKNTNRTKYRIINRLVDFKQKAHGLRNPNRKTKK